MMKEGEILLGKDCGNVGGEKKMKSEIKRQFEKDRKSKRTNILKSWFIKFDDLFPVFFLIHLKHI